MSFVLLDKPKNITSFDACTIAKRDLGFKKAGHSGTLDPLATGLLPVFFDKSTKFIQFLMNKDKTYEAEFLFGCSSDTLDISIKVSQRMMNRLNNRLIRDYPELFEDLY